MVWIKVMAIAIVGCLLSLVLKEQKSYFGQMLALASCLLIFFMGLPYLERVISYAKSLYSSFGGSIIYMETLLKVTAITIVSLLTCNFCKDAGISSIASFVEVCAKLICLFITIPVISDFMRELFVLLPS